jgi:antitoxin VapB
MTLSIKDPATENSVRDLAAATGETVEIAIRRAAEERLQRLRQEPMNHGLAADILAIGTRCAALPDRDSRSAEDILGYDDRGLPT